MVGVLSTAFLGLKDALGMAGGAGNLAKKVLAAPLRETGVVGKPVTRYMAAHPARSAAIGGTLLASGAALSFGGLGPLGEAGNEYQRYMYSRYGDTQETRRLVGAQQGVAIAGGVAGLGLAGFGLFGHGPLAWNYKKATAGLANKIDLGTKIHQIGESISNSPHDAWKGLTTWTPPNRHGHINPKWDRFKKNLFRPRDFGQTLDPIRKHPGWTGLAAGAAFGVGAASFETVEKLERPKGYEGNIAAIGSSPNGGISPELQYSTQDLMFALHRNNKSLRRKYQ